MLNYKNLSFLTIVLTSLLTFITACDDDNDEPANSAPVCAITNPVNGAEFSQGEIITVAVDAEDEDNNLEEVRFYINDIGVGSSNSFPYNFEWDTSDEAPGSFAIKVEAIDELGKKSTDAIDISIVAGGDAPVAAFTASQTTIAVGDSVTFSDQSANSPTSWSWDFGDGNVSTDQNPTHSYSSTGTYTVNLAVSNSYGSDTLTRSDYITVETSGSEGTVTDIDGNVYNTVVLGNQEWMAENLKTTTYNNGTAISLVTNNSDWQNNTTGAYSWYENDETQYANTYGALYNWYAVNTGNLCPDGWHIPTDDEWKTLEMHLGMNQSDADGTGPRGTNEGSKLASNASLWYDGDLEDDPEFGSSGFLGIPAGARDIYGNFSFIETNAVWWCANEFDNQEAWLRALYHSHTLIARDYQYKGSGYSVRCLKD
ncbi:Microbial collagenase precursor [Salinivirga cyanobacteriivorans]|uniref:Microbial collagenase n=1 Tax=Salinivirga cyanobacteriivorans TaxID=1307839 RepID=A0A0S2I4L8_9BACT|nr:FISUMP domain-containing protein [Salinivirga cyanobacteriivorans]ALO17295.1 Microbial collagenase precursor [Salinivirga cyanobacteriivorans]